MDYLRASLKASSAEKLEVEYRVERKDLHKDQYMDQYTQEEYRDSNRELHNIATLFCRELFRRMGRKDQYIQEVHMGQEVYTEHHKDSNQDNSSNYHNHNHQ